MRDAVAVEEAINALPRSKRLERSLKMVVPSKVVFEFVPRRIEVLAVLFMVMFPPMVSALLEVRRSRAPSVRVSALSTSRLS